MPGAGAGCCELAVATGCQCRVLVLGAVWVLVRVAETGCPCWVLVLAVRVVETGCLESWRTDFWSQHGCASHSKAVVDGALREHPYALVPEYDVSLEFGNVLFWKRMSKVCR